MVEYATNLKLTAGNGSHLHKFSSYKCYIFKSSILRNSGARKKMY